MNLLKLSLVTCVAYSAVHGRLEQIISVQGLSFTQIFGLGAEVIYAIGIRIGVLLLVLAIVDYAYQRFRIERELKMTKQEVKEEMRRMEGDPKIKGRRRQIAMQIATQKLKKDVPTADVIVTNPTEFAVALKYDKATMHAPRVIAKGQGFMAARIREIAIAPACRSSSASRSPARSTSSVMSARKSPSNSTTPLPRSSHTSTSSAARPSKRERRRCNDPWPTRSQPTRSF
jgi:flagellar biosynthesis protein FlhB